MEKILYSYKYLGLAIIFWLLLTPQMILGQGETIDISKYQIIKGPSIKDFMGDEPEKNNSYFKYLFEDNKIFLDLPQEQLDKDFLLVRDLVGQQNIKWKKREKHIMLIASEIYSLANSEIEPYQQEYHIGETQEPILATFPILANSENSSYLIDITSIFIHNMDGLPGYSSKVDEAKSFISKVKGFPRSVEIDVIQTERTESGKAPVTYSSHWSLYKLPDKPMKPRLFDPRMGYFMDNIWGSNYNFKNNAAITRWRLNKKVHSKPISEPEKPIIYYLDPNIPKKWRNYVKNGILAWNPAFESAGFKNAIEVRDSLPNPDIQPGNMNYSIVRWKDDTLKRTFRKPRISAGGGGSANIVIDLRSGEILKGDIIIWSPIEFLQDRYFIQAASYDTRARHLPYPDSLMGYLIEALISHEAGHAFGIKDGNFGEFAYPFEKIRSIKWLSKMGHTPSIMNYTRHNSLIQPSDSIPFPLNLQKVGPADMHSIVWGYADFKNLSATNEMRKLDSIISQGNKFPWLRYAQGSDKNGPYGDHEVADNDQPVTSSRLALNNLKRIMGLLPGIALKDREDNYLLEHLYFRILHQWVLEMKHINSVIGGYSLQYKNGNQPGAVYSPIPIEKQVEALNYVVKEAFNTPNWIIRHDITHRFEAKGSLTNISSIQNQVLRNLLSKERINRIIEQYEEGNEEKRDILSFLFSEMNNQIWKELNSDKISITVYRQELQKSYLVNLSKLLEESMDLIGSSERVQGLHNFPAYAEGIIYSNLEDLKNKIENNIERADSRSLGHLKRMKVRLSEILN